MDRAHEWRQAAKILCIRLDALGDVLMTTPALRAIKETNPESQLTLLTSSAGEKIAHLIPEIGKIVVYESPWMKASALRTDASPDFQMISQLRAARFDAAVIFTVFSQNPLPAAMMAYMANIPLRLAHCRENPYQLLTDWVLESDDFGQAQIRHEVQRQLDLVSAVGFTTVNQRLSLEVPVKAHGIALQFLDKAGLDIHRPWLVVHPGASAASRRYPAEYFAKVAQQLTRVHGFQVLFTGAESEVELVESIRKRIEGASFSAAGCLRLDDFCALIALAPLLITNNTGPAHIAAAVGTPVVDLYALTNPQHTPWQVPHRLVYHDVPCKFCYKSICPMQHHNCLRLVTPESVVSAALSLLAETQAPIEDQRNAL